MFKTTVEQHGVSVDIIKIPLIKVNYRKPTKAIISFVIIVSNRPLIEVVLKYSTNIVVII